MDFNQKFAIGIDIGGTNTAFGIVDSTGNIVFRNRLSTRDYITIDSFISAIEESVKPYIELTGIDHLTGIGIGAPNGNLQTGVIEYAPNLPWEDNLPMGNLFSKKFNKPCRITNDANAAAIGEMTYGAAKGLKDFMVITLGTGVGSGIISNGNLLDGFDGYAGELGHTIVIPEGRKHWGTNVCGCLEAYASATGIVITANEFLNCNESTPSLLQSYAPNNITAQLIFECACKGDKIAIEIFQYTGKILGVALANFALFSSPEAIIFFGGLTKAKDFWMNTAKEYMDKNLPPNFRNKTKLIVSNLDEADAAILGAASLVMMK
ncbi:MAG TPA: ROK family protein [Chitinophagaceae bacterium]